MITYLYWGCIIGLVIAVLFVVGGKMDSWKTALGTTALILLVGWAAYYFHYQQVFVKRYGGVMNVSVPKGQRHIATTWKGDNMWIENYDPEKNICIFQEVSKGNVLEGKVTIKNCNPLSRGNQQPAARNAPEPVSTTPGARTPAN